MKKIIKICIGIIMMPFLVNWGGQETSISGDNKQRVNFYGTLSTYSNSKPMNVDNISIGFKYRQIPMYEAPQNHAQAKPISNNSGEFTKREIKLEQEPRISLVTTKIDLSEVSAIRVPHPYITWTYQKTKGYRKIEYIEVEVISKDAQKTKANYLIEKNIKVYCDQINAAGPVEKEVPLPAIKRLDIKGYKLRDDTAPGKKCPVCPAQKPAPVTSTN